MAKGSVRTENTETHQGSLECFPLLISLYKAACINAFKGASRWRKACRCSESETNSFLGERARK
jgi:hypothetical protein